MNYLAVPPLLFRAVADGIAAADRAERSRLVVRNPFGRDLVSAREDVLAKKSGDESIAVPRSDARRDDPAHFARMDDLQPAGRIAGPVVDLDPPPAPYQRDWWGSDAAATLQGPKGWVDLLDSLKAR